MVYIDTLSNGYSHLIADTIQELHLFAENAGINRCWYENKVNKKQPHYDIKGIELHKKCINHGAKLLARRELFLKLKAIYG